MSFFSYGQPRWYRILQVEIQKNAELENSLSVKLLAKWLSPCGIELSEHWASGKLLDFFIS